MTQIKVPKRLTREERINQKLQAISEYLVGIYCLRVPFDSWGMDLRIQQNVAEVSQLFTKAELQALYKRCWPGAVDVPSHMKAET